MKADLLQQFDLIPPCIARLCARSKCRAMSFEEIASRAGKPVGKVVYWSSCPSWEKFTVGDALLFSTACGVDLLRPRKKLFYLRRAFAEKGFQTLAKGLPRGYVEKQIRIRQRYEKRQSGIVNTN